MDNIVFEKAWDDGDVTNLWASGFFEINIYANNSFIKVKDFKLYMTTKITEELSKIISNYIENNEEVSFLNDFSSFDDTKMTMTIKPVDCHGIVTIILKLESTKNGINNAELCIKTELGLLENFGKNIKSLVNSGVGHKVSLYEEY